MPPTIPSADVARVERQLAEIDDAITSLLAGVTANLREWPAPPLDRWWQETQRMIAGRKERGITPEQAWQAWRETQRRFASDPALSAMIALVESCVKALPEVLSGDLAATEVLFPEGSPAQVEAVYLNHPAGAYFEQVIERVIAALFDGESGAADDVRFLELGAGTGGLTTLVLPRLLE